MTNDTQPQLAAGAPNGTGGQFTGKSYSAPEVQLPEATHGSFLYPPINYGGGVEAYIPFWENIAISDRVLSNLTSAYKEHRDKLIEKEMETWALHRTDDPKYAASLAKMKTVEEIDGEHEAARLVEFARVHAAHQPASIGPGQVRGIAMAAQMYRCSGSFSAEDQAIVDNHLVKISRTAVPMSTADIYRKFNLAEIADLAFVDQDFAVRNEIAELRRTIQGRTFG